MLRWHYYSVRNHGDFLRKGNYFISSFCLGLNASNALSAIFAHFHSLLHPNKNIHPLSWPYNSCEVQKNRNFLNCFNFPHQSFWNGHFLLASADLYLVLSISSLGLCQWIPSRDEGPEWVSPSLFSVGQKKAWNENSL